MFVAVFDRLPVLYAALVWVFVGMAVFVGVAFLRVAQGVAVQVLATVLVRMAVAMAVLVFVLAFSVLHSRSLL